MSDFPDKLYHGQIIYRPLLDTGIVALPEGALGAIAVFGSREEATLDNLAHGGSEYGVDMMTAYKPEADKRNEPATPAREGETANGKAED